MTQPKPTGDLAYSFTLRGVAPRVAQDLATRLVHTEPFDEGLVWEYDKAFIARGIWLNPKDHTYLECGDDDIEISGWDDDGFIFRDDEEETLVFIPAPGATIDISFMVYGVLTADPEDPEIEEKAEPAPETGNAQRSDAVYRIFKGAYDIEPLDLDLHQPVTATTEKVTNALYAAYDAGRRAAH